MSVWDSYDLIGAVRLCSGSSTQEARQAIKCVVMDGVRTFDNPDNEPLNPDVVVYVADVAIPRALYTWGLRDMVTERDVYALLTCNTEYFNIAKPHHYAMFLSWWGPDVVAPIFGIKPFTAGHPVLTALLNYVARRMKQGGVVHFVLDYWTQMLGLECYGEMKGGREFRGYALMDLPCVIAEPELLVILRMAADAAERASQNMCVFVIDNSTPQESSPWVLLSKT